jgi:signal transduction histidine kinase
MSEPAKKSSEVKKGTLAAYRVVLIYVIVSIIWIFGSDVLINMISNDRELILQYSTIKGTGFVIATAVLLYFLISRELVEAYDLKQKDRQIKRQEDILRTLSENFPKGSMMLFDLDGRYLEVKENRNDTAQESERYDPTEEIRHLKEGRNEEIRSMIKGAVDGRPGRVELAIAGGYYLVHGVPVRDDDMVIFSVLVIVEDITDIRRSQEDLAEKMRQLAVLFNVSKSLLDSDETGNMMPNACKLAAEGFELDGIRIFKLDDANDELIEVAGWMNDPEYDEASLHRKTKRNNGPDWRTIEEKKVIKVDDTLDPKNDDWAGDSRKMRIRSIVFFPWFLGDDVLGTLCVCSKAPGTFTPIDIQSLLPLVNVLLLGLQKIRFIKEIEDQKDELEVKVRQRTEDLTEVNVQLDVFAHSISHDLRAPVRGMKGFAEALLEDYGGSVPEKGKEYLHKIIENSEDMEQLIQDTLAYSRIRRMDLEIGPLDLRSLLEDALGSINHDIESTRANVILNIPNATVLANSTVLRQVMVNLLSNALKFTKPGHRPEVKITAKATDGMVRISVIDKGIGISQTDQGRIFRLFERLHSHEDFSGTGVGLAIVAKGMERMNGRYGIISEEGNGSEFWVEIPAAGAASGYFDQYQLH